MLSRQAVLGSISSNVHRKQREREEEEKGGKGREKGNIFWGKSKGLNDYSTF